MQPLWLAIVALITWSLGVVYCPDEVPGSTTDVNRALRALELRSGHSTA